MRVYALQPLSLFLTVSHSLYLLHPHICAVCSRCDTNTQSLQLHSFLWAVVFSCFQCGSSENAFWTEVSKAKFVTELTIYWFSLCFLIHFLFFNAFETLVFVQFFQQWNCTRVWNIEVQRILEFYTIHSQLCTDRKVSKTTKFSGLTFYSTTKAFEISNNCFLSDWASIERTYVFVGRMFIINSTTLFELSFICTPTKSNVIKNSN